MVYWVYYRKYSLKIINFENNHFKLYIMGKLKPGPKPIAKSTGEVDKRRRDNKDTPGNNSKLKPKGTK